MSPLCFFDTNVLVHAADFDEPDKRTTLDMVAAAQLSESDRMSFWDALIVQAAVAGCTMTPPGGGYLT